MNINDRKYDTIFLKIQNNHNRYIILLVEFLKTNYHKKYVHPNKNRKYDATDIVTEIIYFLQSGVSYAQYRGPINAKSLNRHILFLASNEIFQKVYKLFLNSYLSKNAHTKLKYQSIDSTIVINKNGKENLGRNVLMKGKNSYKISVISDTNRIPLTICVSSGNEHDAKIAITNCNNHTFTTNNPKIKPYMLGDKGYDSSVLRKFCRDYGFRPILDQVPSSPLNRWRGP